MRSVTLAAHAKLNLTLDILRKREDGYHDLQSVMQTVELHDDVTVALREGEGILCRCGQLPGDESNLAVRGARAFLAAAGMEAQGLDITVEKRIPIQAGLAGGSADAAAVLRALRRLLLPHMPGEALRRVGAAVGSDVPFCLLGGTALAEGRGERLTALRPAPMFHVVLCKPDFSISTPELFRRVRVSELWGRPDTPGMLDALHRGDPEGVAGRVRNVFETVLPPAYREIFAIKAMLHRLGGEATAMSGSGPTVFALFREEGAARQAWEAMKQSYGQTFLTAFTA